MSAQSLLDAFLANLPTLLAVLAALGLWHAAASLLRKLWARAEEAARGTDTAIDDALLRLAKPAAMELIDLIDRGDLEAIRRKAEPLRKKLAPLVKVKR
jgi:hypothetical protein